MIALIVGTNRPRSNTGKVAAHVADIYAALDEPPQIIDLHQLPPEIFSPDSYEKPPASFAPFEEPIARADGIVIVTPEYNGSIPGIFKYYIDMLEKPEAFAGKPVAFVGLAAGMWGALRPVEQIEAMLIYLGAVIYPKRVNIAKINEHLGEAGRVKTPEYVERLEKQAKGFVEFVGRLKKG
jgi:NAD(P)H-dependent FMN reductase